MYSPAMADDLYEQLPDGTYRKARNARAPKLPQPYQPPVANPTVPEARGKAAALDAWLAQGGQPFRGSGKFKKGPFKGKTIDEARAQFERMWATAPDSIKNKYASRSLKTDLAPIEREAAQAKPPVQKAAAPQAAAGPSFEQLTDPAQQFQAIGTDLNQDGQITDADAQANAAAYDADLANRVKNSPAAKAARAVGKFIADMGPMQLPNQAPPAAATPPATVNPAAADAPFVGPPAPPEATTPPTPLAPAAAEPFVGPPAPAGTIPATEAPYVPLPPPATQMGGRGRVGGTSPSGIAGRQGTGASPSAPVAVRNQVAVNAGVPAVMPDQAAAPMPAPTQGAAPPVARPKINSLTGLPFGYRPGDEVAP
jgi:hypothetical protein